MKFAVFSSLWLLFRACNSTTTPFFASETVTKEGDSCIQSFSEPEQLLDCFLEVTDNISTYTLKSRFLSAYGQQFGDTPPAAIVNDLSGYYQQLAARNPAQEVQKLHEEIDRLGKNKEYVRLLNLLMKFKNPELPALSIFIDQVMNKLEKYANKQLDCATYAHEFIEAYTLLTQIYSFSDKVEKKLTITQEAINLFIEQDAMERYPHQFQYFQKQYQQAEESIENSQLNLKSR